MAEKSYPLLALRVSPELEAAVADAANQLDVTVPEYVRGLLLASTRNIDDDEKRWINNVV